MTKKTPQKFSFTTPPWGNPSLYSFTTKTINYLQCGAKSLLALSMTVHLWLGSKMWNLSVTNQIVTASDRQPADTPVGHCSRSRNNLTHCPLSKHNLSFLYFGFVWIKQIKYNMLISWCRCVSQCWATYFITGIIKLLYYITVGNEILITLFFCITFKKKSQYTYYNYYKME